MEKHIEIVRADDLMVLAAVYGSKSWQKVCRSVMEVLEEQLGAAVLATLSPEELVSYGFVQGVGHAVAELVAGEAILEYTGPRKVKPRPRKTTPRPRREE